MQFRPREFDASANEAVKSTLRAGTWPVWERYDVFEGDQEEDAYVLAPEEAAYEWYEPLKLPALFLEFARLAEGGDITREVWVEWIEFYGVLGLGVRDPRDLVQIGLFGNVCEEGGRAETYGRFVKEAREANWLLRLCEAYVSPEGPDPARFLDEASNIYGVSLPSEGRHFTPDQAKRWAASIILSQTQHYVQDCYPLLLPSDGGLVQGWGFHTLLSGMYAQALWLLTARGEDIRWCKRPECTKVVIFKQPEQPSPSGIKKNDRSRGYKTRKDKEFCSDLCRGLYRYHYVEKPRRIGKLSS
jgi:hypothetical protein